MKIILLQDVAKLGKAGDCVNVSDGYARNYLIPRKLAVEATPLDANELYTNVGLALYAFAFVSCVIE